MGRIVCFGELLLRLTSPGYTKLFQKDILEATFCGGEVNVAVSLAILGQDVSFVTKLPANAVGTAAANAVRYFGVDTSQIVYGEGRMGLYYLEKGASQRPSKIIYDRESSSIAMASENDFDWNAIFDGAEWFHWTGINPALSDRVFRICLIACQVARKKGITISCDLNYRKTLWSSEKAKFFMDKLMPFVDICIANEEDADKVLGIRAEETDVRTGKLRADSYSGVAKKICERYGCKKVAITLRKSYSASRNGWGAILYDAKMEQAYISRQYDIQVVDRVGSGDSFAAGVIFGLRSGKPLQNVVDFATAASCLKHTMEGDFNRSSIEDIEDLLSNGGNGRVQR